ncbi:L,D-transpeptidase family protein [Pseudoxanthomonas indica]|uniref:Lipoprotein-anchoring transpeptidase ErfK/SrfK n=1 Tax=Pseudoxanthomonas indica TaxID=428993 RepID=A0A1T5KU75_9GAMM|nr:L,D-transpeptidase [Pseudoxanthomonas indica]GGD51659.1 peptidoglycan-binding protein [Pseudoxanthomonas indica]SKC67257.1 Lipoprotein-anchoring transpeptidase ErfK/SrfK [Pseudoxanthomonas indica]
MSPYRTFPLLLLLTPVLASLPAQADDTALAEVANLPTSTTEVAGLLRAQVLLDRANFSPGEIDGRAGSNQRRALRGFQQTRGLEVTGELDTPTWAALNADGAPAVATYTLTAADVNQRYASLPDDVMEQGKLQALGYESLEEALGERFHASPALLRQLNPGVDFSQVGSTLQVPNVADIAAPAKAAKLVVDKSDSTLTLLDAADKAIAQFPVSSGSEHDPLPIGAWKIRATVVDPTFHYNPKLFWDAEPSHAKTQLAAGPNNPVGTRWIDLSKPHYGLHGTATPASVGKAQSHGCVRLTNWDVERVAAAVDSSVPVLMQE